MTRAALALLVALPTACSGATAKAPASHSPLVVPPRVAPSAAAPAEAASAPPAASSAAPAAKKPAPSPEIQRAAEAANAELDAVLEPGKLGEAHLTVEGRGGPTWHFPRFAKDAPDGSQPAGWLRVTSAASVAGYCEGPDENPIDLAELIAAKKLAPKIVEVANRVPEVAAMCRDAKAQGATCISWVQRMGATKCGKGAGPIDDCVWEIYVGSNMGTHASRLATIFVDPGKLAPSAASDLACPPMTMAGFKKKVAASRAKKPIDDCPDAIAP